MRRGGRERIRFTAHRIAYSIHGIGNVVRRVSRHVLPERGAVHLAPRPPLALGQSFHLLEDLVRD
jgi:hypothetical protein